MARKHTRILVVILVIVLLVIIAGVSVFSKIEHKVSLPMASLTPAVQVENQSKEALALNQFMQKFLKIIEQGEVTTKFYDSFPKMDGTKPSQQELQQYVQVLHKILSGEVLSFTPMTRSEQLRYFEDIKKNNSLYSVYKDSMAMCWIELKATGSGYDRFPFFVFINEQNQPTLLKRWVTDSYRLYSFAQLYFESIKTGSHESLKGLLDRYKRSDADILEQKINQTLSYYKTLEELDKNVLDNLRITTLRGDLVEVEQPYPKAYAGQLTSLTKPAYRYVQFVMEKDSDYSIIDIIPEPVKNDTFTLFSTHGNSQLISLDQPVDMTTIMRIFGQWNEAFFHPDSDGSSHGRISVKYDNLELLIVGDYNRSNHFFSGKIKRISFYTKDFKLWDGITPGMKEHDILLLHPFLNVNNNTLSFLQASIRFHYDDSRVLKDIILETKDAPRQD